MDRVTIADKQADEILIDFVNHICKKYKIGTKKQKVLSAEKAKKEWEKFYNNNFPQKLDHFCDSCIWWQFRFNHFTERFGVCTHLFITENVTTTQVFDEYDEETEIFTNALFGCNMHEGGRGLVVAEIKPTEKPES